ncbi:MULTISPECIES: LysR family transcriptional regulator [Serratia]|jgi:DNA-binding transcriptional LysR family regulator|uniref:LysR family transcriptional regulator n=1 Tax=Serratia liquefaciens TaxID=614 RepID=A0A379ZTF3_SERLI|nr:MULTISPECIES: LysR family transcriptional regulator [Serratia]AGQ30078.1 LysR family transcriptional regulator [Serratia liquefaciens ATCC 27592]AKE11492.1 LysR family transcriptional regulator [Serratia liquefaciens]AYO36846.1 LysR family transcriptional regulator [Serratia sp. P2ACOL2]MBF8104125.1 LysR family transcriptional regulator [Serratia liquefaciens]MBH2809494.1 LysR family transcriptional regulator [Serratia liquefaciens]
MDHHLLAIRVFNRVVETGGFTRAADSLRMPKATVTKLIQSLEDHLQTKLFKRTTRSVSVTPEGECYYQRTVKWLAELEQMEGSMTESQSAPQGVLRIDVGGATARQLLLPALPDFIARYPQIQIDLGVGDRLIDLINDSADCVIRSGPLADSSLIARRLFELEWVTCATPAYLAHYGTPQHPCDLELGYPLAHYRHALNDRILPLHFVDRGKEIDIQHRYHVSVNESNALLAAALAGLGIIQTFRFMAQPHLDSGELVSLLHDWQPPAEQMYVVYPSNRHLSAKMRVFIDWAIETFK